MPRYRVIITTADDRRLHYRTDNETFLSVLHDCINKPISVQLAKELSIDELLVIEAHLDHSRSCEVIDEKTKKSHLFPR